MLFRIKIAFFSAPYKYRRCLVNAEDNDEGFVDSVLCNPKERRRMSAVAACMILKTKHKKRNKFSAKILAQDETDRWEGVRDFLLALGCAIEIDNEREIFIGKRVFEVLKTCINSAPKCRQNKFHLIKSKI